MKHCNIEYISMKQHVYCTVNLQLLSLHVPYYDELYNIL